MNLLLLSFEGRLAGLTPFPMPRETAAQTLAVPASFQAQAQAHMDGRHGRPQARRRAWAEASYGCQLRLWPWRPPRTVGTPTRRTLRPGVGEGGRVGREPRRTGLPARWHTRRLGARATAPLLTDHRLGYWLKQKSGRQTGQRPGQALQEGKRPPPTHPQTAGNKRLISSV